MTARQFKKIYHYSSDPLAIIMPLPGCSNCAWSVTVNEDGINRLRCQANDGKRMSVAVSYKCDIYVERQDDEEAKGVPRVQEEGFRLFKQAL